MTIEILALRLIKRQACLQEAIPYGVAWLYTTDNSTLHFHPDVPQANNGQSHIQS